MGHEDKQLLLVKDPKSLTEAIEFMELIKDNKQDISSINRINDPQQEMRNLLEFQNKKLHETISELNNKIQNLTFHNQDRQNRGPSQNRQACQICKRNNHQASECFYYVRQQQNGYQNGRPNYERGRTQFRNTFNNRQPQQQRPYHNNFDQNRQGRSQNPIRRMNNPPSHYNQTNSPFRGHDGSSSRNRSTTPNNRVRFSNGGGYQNFQQNRNSEN
ncbi:hypothetical protein JTE90_003385 [Oedothorax gibbosus]|uniref:Uncharacterized protein n=1 Tax=Oedothorax gibbosus TaxID=931172 RepID=A0AAV6TZS7_9ARAC|nr:hypothetical protein JTE90_003385 [Oedothorax gibbosus]